MNKKVASWIAGAVQARNECARKVKTGEDNLEWYDRWEDRVERVVGELFPSGSGFDAGTKFDWEKSTSEKLVFHFGYHHLNENGFYTQAYKTGTLFGGDVYINRYTEKNP